MKRMLTILAVVMTAAAVQIVQAAGERWSSQVTTAAVQMMPAVKSIDFAVMDVPIDTTPRGLIIVVQ